MPRSYLHSPRRSINKSFLYDPLLIKLKVHFDVLLFGGKLETLEVLWNRSLLTSAGKTKLYRETGRCVIELNPKLLDTDDKVKNTLVHEMCHAAVFLIDKDYNNGHGTKWLRWVEKAKASDSSLDINVYHKYKSPYSFFYVCSAITCCGVAYGSMKPQTQESLRKYSCRNCKEPLKRVECAPCHSHVVHIQRAKRSPNTQNEESQKSLHLEVSNTASLTVKEMEFRNKVELIPIKHQGKHSIVSTFSFENLRLLWLILILNSIPSILRFTASSLGTYLTPSDTMKD